MVVLHSTFSQILLSSKPPPASCINGYNCWGQLQIYTLSHSLMVWQSAYSWKGAKDGWLLNLIPVETAVFDTLWWRFMFAVQKKKEIHAIAAM